MERRKPFIALLLSMLAPGLGQIYNTELKKGIVLLVLVQLAGIALYIITPNILKYPIVFSILIIILLLIAVGFHIYAILDGYRVAKQKDSLQLRAYNKWYTYVLILALFWGIGACNDNLSGWKSYKMVASSMEPTLLNGDRLLVKTNAYSSKVQPKRGDVIVFVFPEDTSKDFMKRVIALPGDKVEIRDRVIILNGKPLVEEYVNITGDNNTVVGDAVRKMDNMPEKLIPDNKYYVLGDNRDKSYDSRFWGFVDQNALIGKAILIYFSSDRNRIMKEIH